MSLEFDQVSIGFHRYQGLLRRRYSGVLHHISLTLEPGEVVGVIGASGAGKSLLAQAALNRLPANAQLTGDVRLDGRPLDEQHLQKTGGRRIALAPQSLDALDPLLSVGGQIERFARLSGLTRAQARTSTHQVIAEYGLTSGVLLAYPHELSGGMARRALLATATAGGADYLIADEPTVGLDAYNARSTLTHLRSLADAGRGVMVISHDLPAMVEVADRFIVIRAGQLVEAASARAFSQGSPALPPYSQALWSAQPGNGMHVLKPEAA